jgi:hypothetical protein
VIVQVKEPAMRQSAFLRASVATLALAAMVCATLPEADAQRVRAGGAATATRSTASVNRSASAGNYNRSYSGTASASRTTVSRNATVNQNVNVTRNVNVDVDNRCCGNGEALAVAGAVAVTAAAIGSVAHSIPPSCTAVVSGGVTYQQCGSTWYQPQYAGTSVTYVVTSPPQ